MGGFSAIDLSALPAPAVVVAPDFDALVATRKADLVARFAELESDATLVAALEATLGLESEPLVKLIESGAYREALLYARVNAAAQAVMVAFAAGSDLDHLGALYGVVRAEGETDARLRLRVTLAPDAWEGAGTAAGLVYHAMSADARVSHVGIRSTPGAPEVTVTPLSVEGDGTPGEDLLDAVRTRLLADTVKLMTDVIHVAAPVIAPYSVTAHLQTPRGVDPSLVAAQAEARVRSLAAERRAVARSIPLSAIDGALFGAGVEALTRSAPVADVAVGPGEAAHLESVTITTEVVGV